MLEGPGGATVPEVEGARARELGAESVLYLGTFRDRPALAAHVADVPSLAGGEAYPLAQAGILLDPDVFSLAGYAYQLLRWQRKGRHCAACGTHTEPIAGEWGRACPRCRHVAYPPVNPCVIALVHDGDRVLLTHKAGYGPMHGLVAGFVEPGESLEECLVREVREEVGVAVGHLEYFASQPWPFPHQLMVGYFARYAGGDIAIDELELDGAAWFSVDALPALPPPLSIARRLIDHWVERRR